MKNPIKNYFSWLQKDTPTGEVEKFPQIDGNGETSVKGMYVIGDLTGIPLLKMAAESGTQMIRFLDTDPHFQRARRGKTAAILDFVVIGAGPSGIAAGLEAKKLGYNFEIHESGAMFNTILNFPKGKPIYAEPEEIEQVSRLSIREGDKESLLDDLAAQTTGEDLPIIENSDVKNILKKKDHFEIDTGSTTTKALRVILAVGKSGNAARLNVPGDDLNKVYNRLIDPADARGHDVLVVGGGDSALETAIAVAEYAGSVTLSYRKDSFARPKEGNIDALKLLEKSGKVKVMMGSRVKQITENQVILEGGENGETALKNSLVYGLIGRRLPVEFFNKIKVKMEGTLSRIEKLMFAALLLFSGVIYFGKAGLSMAVASTNGSGASSWDNLLNQVLGADFWVRFFTYPVSGRFFKDINGWNWPEAVSGLLGYISFLGFIISALILLVHFFKHIRSYTDSTWKIFKYGYFIALALFFCFIYFSSVYSELHFLGKAPYFWYGFLYSLTILIFGLRRMVVKPTGYIKRQTWTLILIQVLPLFLLPEIILPMMYKAGWMGTGDGFWLTQVFPGGDFGHAYRLILAWPLNIYGLFTDNLTLFWLLYTIVFTFGIIFFIVYRWGKGAYCGWICSCGALAETLGDEYRALAPHGPRAKRWENVGQWVLAAAFLLTGLKLLSVLGGMNIPLIHEPRPTLLDFSRMTYSMTVDIIFAGVLGVGVYFFMSGRIWCRFFCPLAALMHIYTRISRYRIFAEKKKCISCNICTKVCHMGIDVMNYANKGIPMNDVQCVRCSACIVNCPMDVLYFGELPKADPDNIGFKTTGIPGPDHDWVTGL